MVVVNLNRQYTGSEVLFQLNDSGAVVLLAWESAAAIARTAAEKANCQLILASTDEMAILPMLRDAARPASDDAESTWRGTQPTFLQAVKIGGISERD